MERSVCGQVLFLSDWTLTMDCYKSWQAAAACVQAYQKDTRDLPEDQRGNPVVLAKGQRTLHLPVFYFSVTHSSTAMAYYAESTTTTEVTFEDAPKKTKELRLRLQHDRNMLQRLTDWARNFNPESWTAYMSNHHSQIMASLDRNGKLSQEECDELNAKNEEYLQKKMDSFMQKAKTSFQITPQDTPEAIKLKMGVY